MSVAVAAYPPLRVAITTGEPAGIGPEITVQALLQGLGEGRAGWPETRFTVLGDTGMLAERAEAAGLDWARLRALPQVAFEGGALARPARSGALDPANGPYVLGLLDRAIDGAMAGDYDALVTAPLQKSTINDAGIPFTGHTEYLAERTGTARVVMMLSGRGDHPLRVALATTHLPLAAVPAAIDGDNLVRILTIIDGDLRHRFGIAAPRVLVAGLNPHAGENGYLGREEIDIIEPALRRAREAGIDARGPYPADTLFTPRHLQEADCVLAMYHDQGLPVLKYATFGAGINVTLGLPIVRTSVDHGTALDLAGSGRADCGSLLEAIDAAMRMARHQQMARQGAAARRS